MQNNDREKKVNKNATAVFVLIGLIGASVTHSLARLLTVAYTSGGELGLCAAIIAAVYLTFQYLKLWK